MTVENRLQSLEKEIVKLTGSVAELKAGSVSTKELIAVQSSIAELKAYMVIAGGAAAIVLTGLVGTIVYLIVR
jgi:hypothetical protein